MKLKKNWIWDVLEIDWSNINITLNNNKIDLPSSSNNTLQRKDTEPGDFLENIHYYFMLCINRVRHGLA